MKHGNLSINSENIFPIIKKWMYSDQDIFIREMISNGCDAITKRKKLDLAKETELPDDYKPMIKVIVDDREKTLKFVDNGLGMTADEVEEYITQIAFSGATSFLEKYQGKTDEDQIIGHFGLGFYSAFMVADEVHIDTLSFQNGAKGVHWECDGSTEYEIDEADIKEIGTTVTLFLSEDCLEYSNEYRVREVLEKYCSFVPVEIFLEKANAPVEYETIPEEELKEDDTVIEHIHEEAKTREEEKEDGTKETVEVSPAKEMVKIVKRPVSISDIHPLWTKHPNECTEEEYTEFYFKVFRDYRRPLFWIHLNMDYPFNLKGILYFPKINLEYEAIEGTIKLYNNQVFIADNIREVIPEYLLLLKGVIDCPDLPLNVSRSALQNDGFVNKISDYISKKVADKLTGMCKTDRENFEKYWDDIGPFVKFGCMKDQKFADKVTDHILYKDLEDKYHTYTELLDILKEKGEVEKVSAGEGENAAEKEKTIIRYVTNPARQSGYIDLFREQGKTAVVLNSGIDPGFISFLEQNKGDVSFRRIDSELTGDMKEEGDHSDQNSKAAEILHSIEGLEQTEVAVETLKDSSTASVILFSESERRMHEMMQMYSRGTAPDMFAPKAKLILNAKHPLVEYLLSAGDHDDKQTVMRQLYDLAMLSNRPLSADEMRAFVQRSSDIMLKMLGKQ